MKKFIIVCTAVVMFAAGWLFLASRIGMNFQWESLQKTSVETFTAVDGKTILVDQGQGMEPFEIRGVNLGSGIPGHFATDYAIDKETYLQWFDKFRPWGQTASVFIPCFRMTSTMRFGNTTKIVNNLYI